MSCPQQSFSQLVQRERYCGAFYDTGGNPAISAFEQFQQPPWAWYRPSCAWPCFPTTNSNWFVRPSGGENDFLMNSARSSGSDTFPYTAPSLRGQMLRGLPG